MEALKRFLSIEMLIFAMASLGAVSVAWTDVKSDIAVVKEKAEHNEENYDKIDKKLDRIIDYMIRNKDANPNED